jgi:hypothetical protein
MTDDLEEQLLKDFPDLFITKGLGFPKFGGFKCQDGWYDLIRELSQEITYELEQQFGPESRVIYATQVKEKYGTLRFYMNNHVPEIASLIHDYEHKSSRICEVCGKPGKMRDLNWIQTLCDEHNRQ